MNLFLTAQQESTLTQFCQNASVCPPTCCSQRFYSNMKHIIHYHTNIVKEPACSLQKIAECVNKIPVDTSSCIKPCSGLIVTSFFKSEKNKNLELLYPKVWRPYNIFKTISAYPSGLIGKNLFQCMK